MSWAPALLLLLRASLSGLSCLQISLGGHRLIWSLLRSAGVHFCQPHMRTNEPWTKPFHKGQGAVIEK